MPRRKEYGGHVDDPQVEVKAARREGWENVVFLPYQPKETLRFSLAAADVHLVTLRPEEVVTS